METGFHASDEAGVMQRSVSIREAIAVDAQCLSVLAIQTWLHTYATDGIRPTIARYVQEHLTEDIFRSQIARPDAVTIVAGIANHLIGYAVLEIGRQCPIREATAHLDKLFVQAPFLGQGIGFRLLERARAEARSRMADTGLWLTVNSQNERARRFYRRQGFDDIGHTYFDLYGEKHENRVLYASAT